MSKAIDLAGKRFGKLIVLKRSEEKSYYGVRWECVCDCGKGKTVSSMRLRTGVTRSCGCLREFHGHSAKLTPTYNSWRSMKQRCCNPKATGFKEWGGRGIKICDAWINDFTQFIKDMGERPAGTQLDRIDVNGNYEPSNCRWATRKQDSRNRRTTRLLTYRGRTQTSVDWSEELGIDLTLINNRLNKGYSDEEALYGKNYLPHWRKRGGSM